jgi:hypothetical protein
MSHTFFQVRGEIMHEFSLLEYNVRSHLSGLLFMQPNRPLLKYIEQFDLFVKFFSPQEIQWNSKVLDNPDVKLMDAELTAAEGSFDNSLDKLIVAANNIPFPKIGELCLLVEELKEATRQRNILAHSVWHEIEGKIVVHNFLDYHRSKHMRIKGDGTRLIPQPLAEWTLPELENFTGRLRDLSEKLENVFRG